MARRALHFRSTRAWLGLWAACASLALASCYGSSHVLCNSQNECSMASGSYGDALLVAASAGAVFAVVGCTVNGCEMPYECNPETKRCERLQCSEPRACPGGYSCDLERQRCY